MASRNTGYFNVIIMEYTFNTTYNVGTKLYKLNNSGDILSYSIDKIHLTFTDDGLTDKLDILYGLINENGQKRGNIDADTIEKEYYLNKKDIIKHLMEQL